MAQLSRISSADLKTFQQSGTMCLFVRESIELEMSRRENGMDSKRLAQCVFVRAVAAMILLWLAFPPVGFSALGWVALAPLVSVIVDQNRLDRSRYGRIWFAGLCYWLGTFYFIPIPHPLLWFGWLAVSLYLACYLPVFVVSARTMIQGSRIPAVLSIPIAWVGLELIRSYLFTGMGLVCLSHTQYQYPVLIQVSDISGAYTLSFAMMIFVTAIYQFLQLLFHDRPNRRFSGVHLLIAVGIFAAVIGYGKYQIDRDFQRSEIPLNIALIQGSIDATFPSTEEEFRQAYIKQSKEYRELTIEALKKWDDLDLVIWPENGWPVPHLLPETDTTRMAPEQVRLYREGEYHTWSQLWTPGHALPPLLTGSGSVDPVAKIVYGSVLLFDHQGKVTDRYFKNHLVMFGEYVPLANWIPMLEKVPAIGKGLKAGTESISIEIKGRKITPSICFETTVPHYIRQQVNQLAAQGAEPDILANLTNDGWFFGTSALDFHLACNVFRAVEMRKPHLVCANTGLSAVIDDNGRMVQLGPRRQTAVMRATVGSVDRRSLYRLIGDWIPVACAFLTILFAVIGMISGRSRPQQDGFDDTARVVPRDQDGDRDQNGTE